MRLEIVLLSTSLTIIIFGLLAASIIEDEILILSSIVCRLGINSVDSRRDYHLL